MSQLAASTVGKSDFRTARPAAAPPQDIPPANGEEAVTVGVRDSLISYDALGVYFSFLFHLAALGITLLVLWLLNLFYLPTFTVQDPIRASLSDSTILDEEPLMEVMPLEVVEAEAIESPEDAAATLNEDDLSLDVAAVVDQAAASSDQADGSDGSSMFLPKGANAITKGSFTAWTNVQAPKEGDPYAIIIEIKLPPQIKTYRLRDLKGMVVGTDRYRQTIPGKTTTVRVGDRVLHVDKNRRIPVRGNKIQIIVRVPGAERGVVDDVTIRSSLLREQQDIQLKFADPNGRVMPDPSKLNGN